MEEDDEEGVNRGSNHLATMKKLEVEKPQVKKIRSSYEKYQKAHEAKQNWFRARIHLQKGLEADDIGHIFWRSTKKYREKVIEIIEAPRIEMTIFFLILADLGMVSMEMVLESVFEFDHGGGHRLLASDDAGLFAGKSCNIEKAYNIAQICRGISIAILFLFALELLIKFTCAPKSFCHHIGHLLDVFVVGSSIVFEFILHHSEGGLLIFFRSWRAVRIVHGLYEQVEYMMKALETEKHLEHALNVVDKYKSYTMHRNLRDDWLKFKKQMFHNGESQKGKVAWDDTPAWEPCEVYNVLS